MIGKDIGVVDEPERIFAGDLRQMLFQNSVLTNIRGTGRVKTVVIGRRRCDGAGSGQCRHHRVMRGGGRWRLAVVDIGAATDLAAHQPAFVNGGISPADCADGHAKIIGDVPLRRQFGAGGQGTIADRGFDRVCKAKIKRAIALGNVREPICHGDNL